MTAASLKNRTSTVEILLSRMRTIALLLLTADGLKKLRVPTKGTKMHPKRCIMSLEAKVVDSGSDLTWGRTDVIFNYFWVVVKLVIPLQGQRMNGPSRFVRLV